LIRVSIIIDAGFFYTPSQPLGYVYAEMGYFKTAASDIRIFVDGSEAQLDPSVSKIGSAGGTIDFKQFRSDGSMIAGAKKADQFDQYLLKIIKLYDPVPVPTPANFDCTLRFHSGTFRPALIKDRKFMQYDPKGVTPIPDPSLRKTMKDVAHAVIGQIDLNTDEYVSIMNGKTELWSSKSLTNVKGTIDIDITADSPTSERYFCDSITGFSLYWVPNQGMPPPVMWP
jgi:hypothetical protein